VEAEKRDYILRLLAQKTGRKPDNITNGARLLHDLGLDGDDAAEVIAEISKTLKVDISAFDYSKYFRSEPSLLSLLWFLPSQRNEQVSKKRPITVAELINAAELGKLV
jgi:acyl carrier protein